MNNASDDLFFTADGDDVRSLSSSDLNKAIGNELKKPFGSFELEVLRLESNRRDRVARAANAK